MGSPVNIISHYAPQAIEKFIELGIDPNNLTLNSWCGGEEENEKFWLSTFEGYQIVHKETFLSDEKKYFTKLAKKYHKELDNRLARKFYFDFFKNHISFVLCELTVNDLEYVIINDFIIFAINTLNMNDILKILKRKIKINSIVNE